MRSSVIFFLLVALAACKDIPVAVEESEDLLVDTSVKEVSAESLEAEVAVEKAPKLKKTAELTDAPAAPKDVAEPKAIEVKAKESKVSVDGAKAKASETKTLADTEVSETLKPEEAPAALADVKLKAKEAVKAAAEASDVAVSTPTKKSVKAAASGSASAVGLKAKPDAELTRVKRGPGSIGIDLSSLIQRPYQPDDTSQLINFLDSLVRQVKCCDSNDNQWGYPYYNYPYYGGCGCGYGCGYPYYGFRSDVGGPGGASGPVKELPGSQAPGQPGTIWEGVKNLGRSLNGEESQLPLSFGGNPQQFPPGFGGNPQQFPPGFGGNPQQFPPGFGGNQQAPDFGNQAQSGLRSLPSNFPQPGAGGQFPWGPFQFPPIPADTTSQTTNEPTTADDSEKKD